MSEHEAFIDDLRNLIEVVRTADPSAAAANGVAIAALGERVRSITAELEPHVVDGVRMQAGLHPRSVIGAVPGQLPDLTGVTPEEFFPYSPVIGPLNPIAAPFRFWTHGDEVHGTGSFGSAFNGPPGGAHGGHVAALMDELLGVTGVMTGNHGFTGTLSVRYVALTPLGEPLRLRGWVDRSEGRKSWIKGEIRVDDALCVEAEGVFIRPREHG